MAGSGETTMLFTTWRRRVKAAVNRKDGTLHCLILILMEDEPPCRLLWAVTQRHFLKTIFVLFQCRITNANGSNDLLFRLWVHNDAARRYGMMSVSWHLRGSDRTWTGRTRGRWRAAGRSERRGQELWRAEAGEDDADAGRRAREQRSDVESGRICRCRVNRQGSDGAGGFNSLARGMIALGNF
jgi:hypothetical protein